MQSAVVIKSSKAGMTVILDSQIPFDELLLAVAEKFRGSAKFWGSVQMTLTLEGRTLTPEEEFQIVDAISSNSEIEVLCLLDTDGSRALRCEKALNEKLMELNSRTGQFHRGTLKRGDCLESEASIVVIGDVERGAKVTSKGNIIVLGTLKGSASAGVTGDTNAVVAAMKMAPFQVRIDSYSSRFNEKNKKLGWGPMVACVEKEEVVFHSLKNPFF